MKIAYLTDADLRGSGYANLSMPLCKGLTERGHKVKVIGLEYKNEEHFYDFSIISARNMQEALAISQNLFSLWQFDVFVCALDIPLQDRILSAMDTRPFGYVGIMPVEADPLCFSWAMALGKMDKALIISEFGANEARKMGIDAEHIQIGMDTKQWRFRDSEDRTKCRGALGIADDTFVVLTVAANQERKNLARALEIFAEFHQEHPNSKYILVTNEHQYVGWKLRDYIHELQLGDSVLILERGMPQEKLWTIYASSDVFLLPSKAEGLGLPLLESMAVGIPVIGTNCTAIKEVIEDRGLLLSYEYTYRDPFGNGRRYLASQNDGVELLANIYMWQKGEVQMPRLEIDKAREYIEKRDWSIAVDHLESTLLELVGDEDEEE